MTKISIDGKPVDTKQTRFGFREWDWSTSMFKLNGVKYQMFVYPNTNHGFHNDTTPRYDEAAAKLAWSRTLAFLNENLRG